MTTTMGFHFAGSGGPVSGVALAHFLQRLPGNAVNVMWRRFAGYVLGCGTVEVCNASGGSTFAVTGLTAVVGDQVVAEPRLECRIAVGQTQIFLTAEATPEALDADLPGGLQAQTTRGILTTTPENKPSIPLARCRWARAEADGTSGSPPEATLDRGWWPKVLRVSDHPFSKAALVQIHNLLGDVPAPLAFVLAAAERGDELDWPELLRDILAAVTDRFRDRPERTAQLARIATQPEQADVVSGIIRLLRGDLSDKLPASIDVDRKTLRLVSLLSDARPSQQFNAGGSVVRLACGVAAVEGWLALALEDPNGGLYRVDAEINGTHHRALRVACHGTEPLLPVEKGASVGLTISSETSTPSSVGVGLYAEHPSRPVRVSD